MDAVLRGPLCCPRCNVNLDVSQGSELVLSVCRTCGGFWLDCKGLRAELARDDDRLSEYVAGLAPPVMAADHEPTECPVCTKAFEPRMDLGVLVCAQHGAWFEQGALEKLTGADRTSLLELLMGEGSATAQVKPTPEVDSFFAGLRKAGEWADFAETALSAVGLVVALVVFFRKH